jgi:hypothetical protein
VVDRDLDSGAAIDIIHSVNPRKVPVRRALQLVAELKICPTEH